MKKIIIILTVLLMAGTAGAWIEYGSSNMTPTVDNLYNLGDATHRWAEIWARIGYIDTLYHPVIKGLTQMDSMKFGSSFYSDDSTNMGGYLITTISPSGSHIATVMGIGGVYLFGSNALAGDEANIYLPSTGASVNIYKSLIVDGVASFSGRDTGIVAIRASVKSDNILPRTPNTGQVGTAANAFNNGWFDSTTTDYIFGNLERKINIPATDTLKSSGTMLLSSSDKSLLRIGDTLVYQSQYTTSGGRDLFQLYGTGAGIGDANVAWFSIGGAGGNYGRGFFGGAYYGGADTGAAYVGANRAGTIYPIMRFDSRGKVVNLIAGGSLASDTGRFMTVKVAKDTCLEVALFTRTCTEDTLTFMTGADSLTAAYQPAGFWTRGAPAGTVTIGPVVGGKLTVRRLAADTAKGDRYSVTKIMQR